MDLNAYGRVLRRRWYVVVAGVLLAVALATMSYYSVDLNGGSPTLTPRKAELWQSEADLFLTESGFPAGRRRLPLVVKEVGGQTVTQPEFNSPGTFAGLASLYARLAEGDAVRARIISEGGPINGRYDVTAGSVTISGRSDILPIVSFFGKAPTAELARENAGRALRAFVGFIQAQQKSAGIPKDNRVVLQVLNEPQAPILIEPRKRTLPIAVFLAVLFAAVALAFVLENVRTEPAKAERPQPGSSPAEDLDVEPQPQPRPGDGEAGRQPRAPATLGARRRARGFDTLR